jgi:hypothetical protein
MYSAQIYWGFPCFRPQVKRGEDTYSVGPLRKSSPGDGNRSSFRNIVFLLPTTDDVKKSKNAMILCPMFWSLAAPQLKRLVAGFPPRRPEFATGSGKLDLWWTKWRRGRFSPSTLVSPAKIIHSTNFSIITITRGS